jgi:2-oxoglutarate dehydrogenase E2 component (dihydrolipoamide succinyltransferase)
VQVTTDKADIDIPSPVSGVLSEIIVGEGKTVDVGTVIARIDETGKAAAAKKEEKATPAPPPKKKEEAPAPPIPEKKPAVPPKEKAAPAASKKAKTVEVEPQTQENAYRADEARVTEPVAGKPPKAKKLGDGPVEPVVVTEEGVPGEEAMPHRALVEQLQPPPEMEREKHPCAGDMADFYSPVVLRLTLRYDIDLKMVEGTGDCGRITKKDVLDTIERKGKGIAPEAVRKPAERPGPGPQAPPVTEKRAGYGTYSPPRYTVEEGDTKTEFTRMRRLIADHMVYSKATAPHVTTFTEVDMDLAVAARAKNKPALEAKAGGPVTYLHFMMQAAVKTLAEYPVMNSVVQDDVIITKKSINMAVAVDTGRGLMVPVVRNMRGMGLAEIAAATNAIAAKVRDRKAGPDDFAGGTFTVSNPGRKGNLFGTPIISQPQVGVLRMGEIVKRPVVVEVAGEDAILIHPMMYLSLSYDHRVVDGLTANEFLHRVKEHLESGEYGL